MSDNYALQAYIWRFVFVPMPNPSKLAHLLDSQIDDLIARYWHLRDGEFIALVRALLANQLKPVGKPDESVLLGNIQLDEQQTWQWLAEMRYADGASISVDQAAKRLGLKQQVVGEGVFCLLSQF